MVRFFCSITFCAISVSLFFGGASHAELTQDRLAPCLHPGLSIDQTSRIDTCRALLADANISSTQAIELHLVLAEIFRATGDIRKQGEQLSAALQHDPVLPRTRFELAKFHLPRDLDKAFEHFTQALRHASPAEKPIIKTRMFDLFLAASRGHFISQRFAAALIHLDRAMSLDVPHARSHRVLAFRGSVLSRVGQQDAADAAWSAAIGKDADLPWAYQARAVSHALQSRNKDAIEDFERALERRHADPDFGFMDTVYLAVVENFALGELESRDWFEATSQFKAITAHFPDYKPFAALRWFEKRIEAQLTSGRLEDAENLRTIARSFFDHLDQADLGMTMTSTYLNWRYLRPDLEFSREEAFSDIKAHQKELAGKDLKLELDLVTLSFLLGFPEMAEAQANGLLSTYIVSHERARIFEALGNLWSIETGFDDPDHLAKSLSYLQDAQQTATSAQDKERLLVRIAQVASRAGEFVQTKSVLDSLGQQESGPTAAMIARLELAVIRGDTPGARALLARLADMSGNADSSGSLTEARAKLLVSEGRSDEALDLLNAYALDDPRNASFFALRARLRADAGDINRALDDFRIALGLNPHDLATRLNHIEHLQATGSHVPALSEIRAAYRTMLKPNPDASKKLAFLSGISHFNLGDIPEARRAFWSISSYGDKQALLDLWKGRISIREGNVQNSVNYLAAALQRMPKAITKRFQELFSEAGLHTGPIDGIFGPSTQKAIAACAAVRCL